MSNKGKTVVQILRGKLASIRNAALDPGSPSWDDILHLTWEEIEEDADRGEAGFRTFKKLPKDHRFNKPKRKRR